MSIVALLSQVSAENPGLYTLGLPGVVIGWFMFRAERIGNVLISEVRSLNHNYMGMQKVQLITEFNRENCHPVARREIEKMLKELETRKLTSAARKKEPAEE